uniref:Glial cell derived neurotrophic factor b n=1 Tax=Astyanax mexicanus TaxID=7994 RepID=A0A3B1K3W3_ASTMX
MGLLKISPSSTHFTYTLHTHTHTQPLCSEACPALLLALGLPGGVVWGVCSLSSLQAKLNPPVLKVSLSPGSGGRGRCGLRQVQVRVSEVGLGYLSEEELIFRYCSGRCLGSTNYDRILGSLAATGVLQGAPPPACCRPTAYERRLAFLDQHLSYHLLKKHSARRCGCV